MSQIKQILLVGFGTLFLVFSPAAIHGQSLQENAEAGFDAFSKNRFAEAEKFLTAALKEAEAQKLENITMQLILYSLAGAYRGQQKYVEAEQYFRRVLTILEKSSDKNVRLMMGSFNGLGGVLLSQGKYFQAEEIFKKSEDFGKKYGESEPEQMYFTLEGLALAFKVQKKYGEAESVYAREVAFCEKAFGPTDGHLASALEHYAKLLRILRRDSEAEKLELRAKAIRTK